MMAQNRSDHDLVEVIALSGGVGGAKLSLGLQHILAAGKLAVVVNTGDDFVHMGLSISPDLDTTLYTLAGRSDEIKGWGRAGESWNVMTELKRLEGPTWFQIGDSDMALHLERTHRLAHGESLSRVTQNLASRFQVPTKMLPMSDGAVRTRVDTDLGLLEFQDYFVRLRCEPVVHKVIVEGAGGAAPPQCARDHLASPHLRAIVICPSNPYLSIDPILSMPFWKQALSGASVPVIAVSPIIGGRAVKGPAAKIMRELGIEVSPVGIADHYAGLIDGLVIDEADTALARWCALPVHVTRTLMTTLESRASLAREVLDFASRLSRGAGEAPAVSAPR